ncbi:hypothetical protein [Novipirellula caenicola]|uniref:Chromosome partition protein Smc n=1 Tax=Novipirellula caenicola TaxID=1536901 RepID=A0ABP9VKG2_9BACT
MTRLQQQIAAVQNRQQRQWMGKCVMTGMLISGGMACLVGLARLLTQGAFGWGWIAVLSISGPLIGFAYSYLTARSLRSAATAIDKACNLKDRTETALQFHHTAAATEPTALQRLQLADAEAHAESVQPDRVVPPQRLRAWPIALSLTAAAVVLAFISGPPADLTAAEVRNDVVDRQALRVEDGLEELKSLQEERQDPELDELLKDLQLMVEQLKEPGMDPKEALAKLSEMEASLQEMQQKLDDPHAAEELQQVGDALSLSDAMAMAGQALSKGEMEKAADELEKLEMPELDRKTEKAITEQLNKLNQDAGDGNQKKSIQEAATQISQGLSQGNRGKFSDGMKGLASEARKQGQKKKLSDLLRKQCQCLGECKSECESECRSQAMSNKKGGNKAGSAASGNDPGDKTAKLKTQPQMNLKGQESSQGDVDVETEASDQQQQAAVRAYREKADEYEALSESVLESESIPLGHRQTIRKYFEMIRPNGSETDAVNEQTRGADQ